MPEVESNDYADDWQKIEHVESPFTVLEIVVATIHGESEEAVDGSKLSMSVMSPDCRAKARTVSNDPAATTIHANLRHLPSGQSYFQTLQ